MPHQQSIMYSETPSAEEPHTMSNPVYDPNTFDTTSDDNSVSEALQVSENSHTSRQNQSSYTTDEMTPVELLSQLVQANVNEFAPYHQE